jgi:RNA recognition motif-containing protein
VVVYQQSRDAARAVRELQNTVLNGRPIFVREDREQGGRGSRGNQRKGNRGVTRGGYVNTREDGEVEEGCQLFVNNLSWDTSWQDLKDHFRQCGEVERVEVIEGPDGRKKGFGTVRFFNAEDAANAIQTLNGVELQGRELSIRYDSKAH